MAIPQPQYQAPQHEEPGSELDSRRAVAPQLFVPPPQFGRLPHNGPLRESAPSQVPQPDTSSGIAQPEPLAGFGGRAIIFLIDYGVPILVLILLFCLGARIGSTAWRLVLAVVGVGLLGCGVWNRCYRRGATGRSLGARVVAITGRRKLAR
jgi:hypothetical protein